MIKRIHHIGIGVRSLEETRGFFERVFGLASNRSENFGELRFSFIPLEGASLELLRSTTPEGVMEKFMEKKGPGIHHIAMEVDDIEAELDRLKEKGVRLINEKPYLNAHRDRVAFIHPQSAFGVLIELIQACSQ